ncbi:MAG: phytanoyl-CoA dioxygenase family protein, partial [Candidatus Poribacteria bacterium]|nr:phytanoyl-CoA dioxygenase family protein [Candidatus Poribacteria bacterium]
PERVRGIYCRLPMGEAAEQPLVCHCDVGPDSLHETPFARLLKPGIGAVGLIALIPPQGGAFTVWLGTHKIIYDLMIRTEGLARNQAYKQQIIDFNSHHHVEGWGQAGDVLLWHRLLAHTAGWNRSETLQLREAVLCDYAPREAEEAKTSYQDMWEDWSDEVRAASG